MIFLGSQRENEPQSELPYRPEFAFRPEGLINLHPRAGEPPIFSATETHPETEDYAVVSLHAGLVSTQRILILAGGGTLGTQAAVEFVCSRTSVQELLSKLAIRPGAAVPAFEAVLRVKVSGGVPIHTDLVALHSGLK